MRPWPSVGGVKRTGDPITDAVVTAGVKALRSLGSAEAGDQLFVGGSSRWRPPSTPSRCGRSSPSSSSNWWWSPSSGTSWTPGLTVAIGTEHGLEPLASCAIVVMLVSVDGEEAGTIGLLGPTRMNYPLALAAAADGRRPAGAEAAVSEHRTMSEGPWR